MSDSLKFITPSGNELWATYGEIEKDKFGWEYKLFDKEYDNVIFLNDEEFEALKEISKQYGW